MIIDDEYSQYEMFRIINKAHTDAISHFSAELAEAEGSADPAAAKAGFLAGWQAAALNAAQITVHTEESEYNLNYSGKLKELWEKELAE